MSLSNFAINDVLSIAGTLLKRTVIIIIVTLFYEVQKNAAVGFILEPHGEAADGDYVADLLS